MSLSRHEQFFLVITTYNRADYLGGLLDSVAALNPAPDGVIVVDNASTDTTAAVIETARAQFPVPLIHHLLAENSGGAGGFSAGVERALAQGAQWIWLMDDDVTCVPGAIGAFAPWMDKYDALVGRRYDAAGEPFYWQNNFSTFLGFPLPVRGDVFATSDEFATNVGCFEGMLLHKDAVAAVGLPDPRFFLTWDDTTYGWLISLDRPVVYVNEFVLHKARAQRQIDLGIRHLNDSSDLGRFYVMRNRGLLGQYLRLHGRFNPVGFALGTALTAAKEVVRLLAVEKSLRGSGRLVAGWRESRQILAATDFKPMPALKKVTIR
ncbi:MULTISPECIES: glycosyltransferase [Arthrobacter]|uniref:Glycosyl transferase n=1 Tax=Arthrobacter psychrochitiniphilus TaxID=291045 RepID=A0A2V3DPU9_9MICC|nr:MULTISPECIES: glycosyltransferase [Arthrobacter]NYG18238.1 glycosyltransferase involved in cell wall biosynthesis [Arthrobacter psychrochitiniphilus]PXA64965.1 glycosyl transferase [Arthrobacter psychrochitiniphilus]